MRREGPGASRRKPESRPKGCTAVLFAAVVMVLAACGSSSGTKVDYKSASSGPKVPPLEVPPDLTRPGRDDRYQVPEVAGAGPAGGSTTLSDYTSERTATPRP